MDLSQTNLPQQTRELIPAYEFRVNRSLETRPTLECRRRGTHVWTTIAFIPPDSNYYTIMCQTLVDCANELTPKIEVEKE